MNKKPVESLRFIDVMVFILTDVYFDLVHFIKDKGQYLYWLDGGSVICYHTHKWKDGYKDTLKDLIQGNIEN